MTRIEPKQFIELEDIQVNPEHWTQKISIIEFRDKKGKTYWTKDYNFIPKWKRYKEAKDWIKETNFPEYDCKIVWNDNNGIEIVTQNYFGTVVAHEQAITWIIRKIQQKVIKEINDKLDFNNVEDLEIKKDLEIILGFKTYEQFFNTYNNEQKLSDYNYLYEEHLEELKSAEREKGRLSGKDLEKQAYDLNRPDLAILWRKQLYFISGWKYIDNYKLSVQFTAFKCPLAISYPTWLTTQGIGTLEVGPVVKDYSDKPVLNKKGQRLLTGHRFHYDFCQDLGIKVIYENAFKSYQPKFTLLVSDLNAGGFSFGADKGGNVAIPTDIVLRRTSKQELDEVFTLKNKAKFLNALSPKSLFNGKFLGGLVQMLTSFHRYMSIGPEEFRGITLDHWEYLDKEEILFGNKPGITSMFIKQPHLLDHTTFQFYVFNKITMTANGRYLGITEKDGKFILPYKLFISMSPGNIYYRWQFGFIYVKMEISTEATFQDHNNPLRYTTGVKIEAATFGAGINWKQNKPQESNHQGEPLAEQEGQTERMFKSTYKDTLDKTTEPLTFHANTIDFHYSMGEFFNRLTDPLFFYHVDIPELLYNNLNWANKKATYLGLPFEWKELGSWAQSEGFYKWKNVYLESDYQGFWSNLMKKGYLLTNGEDQKNPKLTYNRAFGSIITAFNPLTGVQAEEEIEEKIEIVRETLINADMDTAEFSIIDYIGSQDANIWQQMGHRTHVTGWGSGGKDCLGCLCGGGSHGNPNYNFERTYNFTSGGTLTLKTTNSGEQTCTIPDQGGKVKFWAKGKEAKIDLETEIINRTSRIKPSVLPPSIEIDQEQLEAENFETEQITVEQENAEEILKGIGDGQERETVEPEQETEKESEQEKEGETEKETETERENEKETEQEKERENESEQEKLERERLEREEAERKEQEKKEDEGENEDENE